MSNRFVIPIGSDEPRKSWRLVWSRPLTEDEERALAEAAKPKPMCPDHPGQIATHCGPCRSERLAVS